MNEMQMAARKLHALGFATLPIKPGTKEPATAHGVNDAPRDDAVTDAFYEKRPNFGIGVSGDGFVIFDFDVHDGIDGRDQLLEWDLPDTLCQTTPSGGYHMIYRCDEEIRPSVNSELAVDVRGWHSYIVCDPTPGYCFEDDCEIADADEAVMAFLEHVRPQKKKLQPFKANSGGKVKTKEGQGRNNELFAYGASLQSASRPDEEIEGLMYAYNKGHFDPPLDEAEFQKCVNSVLSTLPKGHSEEVKEQEKRGRGRPKKFEHNKVARMLIEDYGACLLDGETPAIRDGGRYRIGWDAFDSVIIDIADDCTTNNRREVKSYVQAKAAHKRQSSPFLIAFKNGVLDIRTLEFRDWSDTDVIANVVPHNWNPDAKTEVLDNVLYKMACGDIATYMNLAEFIGVCMVRSAKLCPFFPVLIGVGSNGKSTYIELLKNVVGDENISGLQPKEITARFMGSHIVGKTANLGDDIASGYLDDRDCAVIKSVATGDLMFTDVKGGKGFHYQPYCTMVFSCNQFPRLADTTPGFMRRLFPIEFNAVFSADDDDYDPMIGEKLREESVLEYACLIGVEGLRRVIEQNRPTPNEMSESMKGEIAREGNTGLQWFNDESITAEHLIGMTKEEVHREYLGWCERNGYARTAMASGTLSALIGTYYRLKCTKSDHREYADGRKSVKVYEPKVPSGATN